MTPLEKRLARRIHNQRRRLRQLETFENWRLGEKVKRGFMNLCIERGKRIKELEALLASSTAAQQRSPFPRTEGESV